MKIQHGVSERSGTIGRPATSIGTLKKESEMLDKYGNVIDPRTKQILKHNTDK